MPRAKLFQAHASLATLAQRRPLGHVDADPSRELGTRSSPITPRVAQPGDSFFRYTKDSGSKGNWLGDTLFSTLQEAAAALDIARFGNTGFVRQIVFVRSPTLVFEGAIANGMPGVSQTLVFYKSLLQCGLGVVF